VAKHKHHNPLVIKPHHKKPYRLRHIGLLVLSVLMLTLFAIEIGLIIGQQRQPAAPKPQPNRNSVISQTLRSGYGFSLDVNRRVFDVEAVNEGKSIKVEQTDSFANDSKLSQLIISPTAGSVDGRLAASKLTITVNPDKNVLSQAKTQAANKNLPAAQIAAQLFGVDNNKNYTSKLTYSAIESLNGKQVYRRTYEFTDNLTGGKSYGVIWTGEISGRAYQIRLVGLVGSAVVPAIYQPILNSLSVAADQAVLGAQTNIFASQTLSMNGKLDTKYLSDAVSPAVVQIFHTVCGILNVGGKPLADSACISMSGSGFLATSDGYIATNGHVVVYDARDALANLLTTNDSLLSAYLASLGVAANQTASIKSNPPALAAVISKVYDMTPQQLNFSQNGELVMVALGKETPKLDLLSNIRTKDQLAGLARDTNSIKIAKVIGYNYSAKDKFTAVANPNQGFSSSDVALLKINVQNAPTIPIETGQVVQNQKIVLMGFPGDASNPLIDNNYSDVTVTDGVISAIRQAAGGRGQLYQSDVDASHGNSGGPAIDDQGKAIGLLTYRYVDSQNGNSPKSYIRDITDFTDLAKNQAVKIDSNSKTSQLWLSGLINYSNKHYSDALKQFNEVYEIYPSHRLAGTYIYSSKKAIASGQDVKNIPLRYLIAGLIASVIILIITIYEIAKHQGMHKVYQVSQVNEYGHRRAVIPAHTQED